MLFCDCFILYSLCEHCDYRVGSFFLECRLTLYLRSWLSFGATYPDVIFIFHLILSRYATASARSDGLLLLCGGRDANSVVGYLFILLIWFAWEACNLCLLVVFLFVMSLSLHFVAYGLPL